MLLGCLGVRCKMSSVRCNVSYVECDVSMFHVGDVLVFPKGLGWSFPAGQQNELRVKVREPLEAYI